MEEIEFLMKRLYEIEKELSKVKVLEKEAESIKKRLKDLFPDGGQVIKDDLVLTVKKIPVIQYNIPQEIKEQYKVEGVRYNIDVRKLKE